MTSRDGYLPSKLPAVTSGRSLSLKLYQRRERQAYTKREQFPTRHDKAVRAQSIVAAWS